jgi:hypothetical protein
MRISALKTIAAKPLLLVAIPTVFLVTGCSLFQNPTPAAPTQLPPPPVVVQTEVAETLTAVAPTPQGGGTPIPPPTQVAVATATGAVPPTLAPPTEVPGQPTLTPGGEGNPPTVQLLAPTQGVQLAVNQAVNVVALVADDAGVRLVEFYADNVLQGSQTPNNPTTYQAVFPWSSTQIGQHTLFVIAYDVYNNASAPATVSVTVNADTTAPQVSILAPPSPQNVGLGAQLQVQAAATDAAGVTQLQILVDNQPYNQVNSQNPAGQNPFAATFIYAATSPGAHTIIIRAVDAAGNIGNSGPLTVNVADNNPPSVTTNYSRYNVRENEQVTVYTNATDAAGIQRVELWADGGLYNVYNSPNPPAQTSLSIQQIWTSNTPGNHTLFVRVFDVNNQSTATPATTIFVRTPDQPTPTWTPFVPTRTPYPTRTPPPVVPPPNCQMQEPNTNFRVEDPNPIPIRWVCNAPGGMSVIQVYGQYSGTMATQISQEPGNGGTEQGGAFDWTAPSPGVVDVFVVAIDRLGQRGESPHIPGVVEHQRPPTMVPPPTFEPPPTVEPERPTIEGRWRGDVDGGFFMIELQARIGCSETQCAYGGTFEDHREGDVVTGEINGQFDGSNLTLSVSGAQPGDVTWNFEGEVTAGGREIVGQWSEARAGVPSLQRGSVSFRRE